MAKLPPPPARAAALRLAIMGGGMIGREHVGLARKRSDIELVGLADPAPAGKALADAYDVPHFADYIDMLDKSKPDAVIVALPNTLHVPAGLACIERKIPSLVEKPIAETVAGAMRLVEASEAADIPVLVGHHRRHSPDIATARRVVETGVIGRLVAATGTWLADKPATYFNATWRKEPGGGPLLINMIHEVDLLRFICGEIESVKAFVSNDVRGFAVEDTAAIAFRFANGALGTFAISDTVASPFHWEATSGQALYFPNQPGSAYRFGGTSGALSVPDMYLWKHMRPDDHWQDPFVRHHVPLDGSRAYDNQLQHFIDVVRGKAKPLISARDGTATLAATLAIDRAAREDRTVTLKEMMG